MDKKPIPNLADVMRSTMNIARRRLDVGYRDLATVAYRDIVKKIREQAARGKGAVDAEIDYPGRDSDDRSSLRSVGDLVVDMLKLDGFTVMGRTSRNEEFILVRWDQPESNVNSDE